MPEVPRLARFAMRIHDPRLGDPVIEQPQPVTLLLPILEASLARAGAAVTRDELLRRFMAGAPRVVIVSGARDHPAQTAHDDVSRRAVAALWQRGALPFETQEPAVCDGVAHGHYGMSFSLASRNVTALSLVTQLEAHVYDAALCLESCDKRPVADLAAVVEVDLARRRRGKRPFYACFLPAPVMPERHLPPELATRLRALRGRAGPAWDEEIETLAKHRLKCNTYAMLKKLLDGLEQRGAVAAGERDALLAAIAPLTCEGGGTCAFIGTGNTDRVVLHALGLVPRAADLLTRPAQADVVERAVELLLSALRSRNGELSTSALVRANLRNALRVYCAIGGSMNWMLHFPFVAAFFGIAVTPGYIARLSAETPFLLDVDPAADRSFYTLAVEKAEGAVSGLDSTLKQLLELGLLEDAPTLEGRWFARLGEALPPNDNVLRRTPLRSRSGIAELHGNFADSAVFKHAGLSEQAFAQFDHHTFVVAFYLGEARAQEDLFRGRLLERLRGIVPAETVRRVARANFGAAAAVLEGVPDAQLLDTAAEHRLLRVLVVIAGEGPKANGIPEMFYPSEYLNRDPLLRHVAALVTDGRYAGASYGPCIGHASPEALDGGGIGALRTGDLVHLDTEAGRIDVLDPERCWKAGELERVPFEPQALLARPERAQRLAWLRQRRAELPASVRLLLDTTTSCREGVTPAGLEIRETW